MKLLKEQCPVDIVSEVPQKSLLTFSFFLVDTFSIDEKVSKKSSPPGIDFLLQLETVLSILPETTKPA